MVFHLAGESRLWQIDGVRGKLGIKISLAIAPVLLLFAKKIWFRRIILLVLTVPLFVSSAEAATRCQHARELLDRSGTARDADENIFGKVKTKPPYGTFPSDMDKITWWGEFKPFEFWESPKFEAVWIKPDGEEAARQKFRGNKCRLAKTQLKAKDQPRGEFQPGLWSVVVTCDDYLIDKQSFGVLPVGGGAWTGPDQAAAAKEEPVTIWAKDEV